jgi:glycosyltransferase involved in cell wall biosynthesis
VLPGGGGVQLEAFYPPDSIIESDGDGVQLETSYPPVSITKGDFTVINPRGIRAYVCNEAFFRAIPKVLQRLPGTRFSCIGMVDEPQALRWLDELGIAGNVRLLPKYTRLQMGDLFRQSQVVVSPSTHDGTPNTLLEAMACGCFPVAGDIESLREWITPGVNGLLVNPADPQDLAHAIIFALERGDLRRRGRVYNLELVARRAEHSQVMRHAEQFYRDLIA